MVTCRFFDKNQNIFGERKIIFFTVTPGAAPAPGPDRAPVQPPTPEPQGAKPPESKGALQHIHETIQSAQQEERNKVRAGVAPEQATELAAKQAEKLEEVVEENKDEGGDAKEYIETFTKDKMRYDALVANLKIVMKKAGTESAANYENWPLMDPADVAKIFDLKSGMAAWFVPRGRGRIAFVNGLKEGTADTDPSSKNQYEQSHDALVQVVNTLHERFQRENRQEADANQAKNQPLFGHTVGDIKNTLMKNLRSGSGPDKAMIIGALGLLAWIGYEHRDSEILFGFKLKDIGSVVGGAFLINFLSGKASKDGKTLFNRATDMGLKADDLQTPEMRSYAALQGFDKNEAKMKAFEKIKGKPVSKLFELYTTAANPSFAKGTKMDREKHLDQRWLNTEALGFDDDEIDGYAAYDLVEDLVKRTALNQGFIDFTEKNPDVDLDSMDESQIKEVTEWTSPAYSREKFINKYINGPLKGANVSMFQAVQNEYPVGGEADVANAKWQNSLLYQQVVNRIKQGYTTAKGVLKKGYEYGVKYGKEAYYFTRREVVGPAARWVQNSKYSPYPYMKKWALEGVALLNEQKLKEVLPESFHAEATSPDKCRIFGYPDIPFESKTTVDHRDVVEINGIEFDPAKGVAGNKANQDKLEQSLKPEIKGKINDYLGTNSLKFDSFEWSTIDGVWMVRGVEVGADPALNMKAKKDDFVLNFENRDKIQLFSHGREILDVKELSKEYTEAIVQKTIWEKAEKEDKDGLGKFIPGLPTHITGLGKDPQYGFRIEGEIAGLKFIAVGTGPNASIEKGIQFINPKTQTTGGFEQVDISEENGLASFTEAIGEKLKDNEYFHRPFVVLEAQMENTSEGFIQRLTTLFADRKLWVIPMNGQQAINGKIAHRHWKFMLDSKEQEATDMFMDPLKTGQSNVADVGRLFLDNTGVVTRTHLECEKLSRYIASFGEESKADHYGEFLNGKQPEAGKPVDPHAITGLENMNYDNKSYVEMTGVFKNLIADGTRYNYPGFESLDVSALGVNDKAHEIYNVLLRVWSYHTRKFASGDGSAVDQLSEPNKKWMYHVLYEIHNHLEVALNKGTVDPGRTIYMDELPEHTTDLELRDWVHPMSDPPDPQEAEFFRQLQKHREGDAHFDKEKPPERKEVENGVPIKLGTYHPEGRSLAEKWPEAKDLIEKMDKIEDEQFLKPGLNAKPNTKIGIFENKNAQPLFMHMATDMKQAILYKAVVENWSQEELTKEYERRMQHMFSICYDESIAENIYTEGERMLRYMTRDRNLGLGGINEGIKDNPLTPSHKALLMQAMQARDDKMIKDEEGEKSWFKVWNYFENNSGYREYVEEDFLPFYKELYADKAIVEKESDAEEIVDAYEEHVDPYIEEIVG